MGSFILIIIDILLVLVATAAAYPCQAPDGFTCSRATYYGSPQCPANPKGACGYEEYGMTVNNGLVGGVSRLYRNGSGCGACYQVRCNNAAQCSDEGSNIVVTDFGVGPYTDFVLTARAFASLARPGKSAELLASGVVDIEFRRIPCRYSYNLMLKVHERSAFPHYLAIVAIYQAGAYDITDAQMYLEDCKQWRGMRRVFGCVWDIENPPRGPLNIRFQLTSSITGEVKWVQFAGTIPSEWKAGVAYDTTIQLD